MRSIRILLAAACIAASVPRAVPAEPAPAPADLGLRESTEVKLVLVDVLVLDRKERTVPGLAAADFEVLVDGDPVPIASFDSRCTGAPVEDPRGGQTTDLPAIDPANGRIVLAFDWSHMNVFGSRLSPFQALHAATTAVEEGRIPADGIMVVSIGDGLRVELPFTDDRERVLATLHGIEHDPWILSGHEALTDFPFFRRLFALLDLMERIPDRKAIVLFSGPMLEDGWTHDNEYARLASMAATSRTSIYPVEAAGMRTMLDPTPQPLGGPPRLHRIADDTGGRMTADTNDLSLGIARAARDLACTYTLGIKDPAPRLDRSRRLTVLLPGRRGVRAVYPESYLVRSAVERARSLLETATLDPASFQSDDLRIDVHVDPRDGKRKRRDASITVAISPMPFPLVGEERQLRGFVRTPTGAKVHSFERCIAPGETTLVEPVSLRPGHYFISVVLEGGDEASPIAAVAEVTVLNGDAPP